MALLVLFGGLMKSLSLARKQQYSTWYGGGSGTDGNLGAQPASSRDLLQTGTSLSGFRSGAAVVAGRIARSMLGRAVTIRLENGQTIHGIVTNVLAAGRKPKVIVGGLEYPLANLLTAAPPEMGAGSSVNA
jgi:hypothetical protein